MKGSILAPGADADAEVARLKNDFREGRVTSCHAPPFALKDNSTVVYEIARHPGWYFLTTAANDNGEGLLIVTARYRQPVAEADVDFEPRPEGLRSLALEQWVLREMQIVANTRAAYPDCKLACHNRELELKSVLAEAKQQKVADQHSRSTPREEYDRGRAKERKLVLDYLASVESDLFNPDTVAVIHSMKLCIADGRHDQTNAR